MTVPTAPRKHEKHVKHPRVPMAFPGRRSTMFFLVAGAILYVCATIATWFFNGYQSSPADYRDGLLNHPTLAVAGPLLAVSGVILLTLGMWGLLVPASRRAPAASRVAAVALAVQLFAFTADMGGVLTLNVVGVSSGTAVPQVVLDSLAGESGALPWIGLVYLLGWLVGTVALVVALFRSRITPWWVPTALAVSFLADSAGIHPTAFDFQLFLLVFAAGGALAAARTPAAHWHGLPTDNGHPAGPARNFLRESTDFRAANG